MLQVDACSQHAALMARLHVQILVVLPAGTVGNSHPVRALQLGEATACAPKDRYALFLFIFMTHAMRT